MFRLAEPSHKGNNMLTYSLTTSLVIVSFVLGLGIIAAVLHADAIEPETQAIIETQFGGIEVVFFPDKAPKHVENFVKLAKSGFYNGTIFHRVIPGFVIQGGDPNTKKEDTSQYGMGGPGYTVKAEFNDRLHERGTLSMARSQDPDSAGSQFFIVLARTPHLDGKYTVFGKVVKGMEAVDKIVNLPRGARDMPLERVEMTVRIVGKE
jgi:peptidyl-prolyl cis-trans isomerase B (cyclophilin B)